MKNLKPPLLVRVREAAFSVSERLVTTVMDPAELEELNRRVVTQFVPLYARRGVMLFNRIAFLPYKLLRFAVNVGLFFTRNEPPSIGPLVRATDLFPTPKTRKLLKKLIADQGDHIQTLTDAGRFKTARWIWLSSWFLLVWYGFHGLVTSVAKAIRGRAA